jgi:exosome complex component RRP4
MSEEKRQVVVPGEVITDKDGVLPGDGTEKREKGIVAMKFGLVEGSDTLVKVIPLSGTYVPRRGNTVIGKVVDVLYNGWLIDIGAPVNAFLPVAEYPKYVDKNALDDVMTIGDMAVVKVWNVNRRGIDLSMKSRGLMKIHDGIIIKVNPHRVPRVIGKEGSMVILIKEKTNCNITVGQNGRIWLRADKIEEELLAKRAVQFVADNSFVSGLTEKVIKWFEEQGVKG